MKLYNFVSHLNLIVYFYATLNKSYIFINMHSIEIFYFDLHTVNSITDFSSSNQPIS